MVLGNSSNIIVRDSGIEGFVIMFDHFHDVRVNGYVIEAEAGAKLIDVTHVARYHSLTRLLNLLVEFQVASVEQSI